MTSVHSPIEIDRTKCGEVFRLVGNQIIFSCMLCYEEIDDAKQFQTHLLQHFEHIIINIKIEKQDENCENSFEDGEDEILQSIDDDNDIIVFEAGPVNDIDTQLRCDICLKTFTKRSSVVRHMRDIHPEHCSESAAMNDTVDAQLQCNICLETFKTRLCVRKHKRDMHFKAIMKDLQCYICSKTFTKRSSVKRHMRDIHLEDWSSEIAAEDDIETDTKHTHDMHLKDCSEPESTVNDLECHICLKTFTKRSSVTRHMRDIHPNNCSEPFIKAKIPCGICLKKFHTRSSATKHRREIHFKDCPDPTTLNDLQCDICWKKFTKRSSVVRHMRDIHSITESNLNTSGENDEKPNALQLVNEIEKQEINSNDSAEENIVFKPLQCEICMKTFSHTSNVVRHKRDVHFKELNLNISTKRYGCNFCSYASENEEERDRHESNHLKQQQKQLANENFNKIDEEVLETKPDSELLMSYSIDDMIIEDIDDDQFLQTIEEIDNDDNNDTIEMNIDTDKTYKCEICSKTFTSRSILKRHMDYMHFMKRKSMKKSASSPYECDFCNFTCLKKRDCDLHISRHFKNRTTNFNNKTTKYNCDVCKRGYNKRPLLVRHLNRHTELQNKFKCKLCSLEVSSKATLDYHLQTNHPSLHTCRHCQMEFKSYDALKTHEKTRCHVLLKDVCQAIMESSILSCTLCELYDLQCIGLKQKHFIDVHKYQPKSTEHCSQCTAIFRTADELNEHEPLHLLANLPKCMHCGETFQYQSDLLNHLATKSSSTDDALLMQTTEIDDNVVNAKNNEKRFRCNICNRRFLAKHSLKRHYLYKCSKATLIQCEFCSFSTRDEISYKKHIFKHTGERAYKCDICEKTYADFHYLEVHARIHSGEKTHVCMICGMAFYMKSKLTMHMKEKHNEEKKFNCDICGKGYTKRIAIIAHLNHHADFREFKCLAPNCDKAYYSTTNLRTHRYRVHNNIKRETPKVGLENDLLDIFKFDNETNLMA